MLSWVTRNWFLAGLLATAILAFLFPEAGASGGVLRTEVTTKLTVAVLFLIRGTLLPLTELGRAALAWRLHLLVHACIFLLFPLGVILLLETAGRLWEMDPALRLGFFFLAVLPTTVSTATVFTSLAGGNTAGSVFNATTSNCLGVIVVPLWIAWFFQREAVAISIGPLVLQIVLLVVVPLLAGQAVKPFLREFSVRHRKALEIVSSCLILYVIFAAFANAVVAGLWEEQGTSALLGSFAASLLIFVVATLAVYLLGRITKLSREDLICLLFCAPQKTLATGVTIANVLFAGNPALTLILLPVLFYHFIQLLGGGFLISGLRQEKS